MDASCNIGMLFGHSFLSGLSDHFSQCGHHVVTATNIAYQLSISIRVDEFHLVGTCGACVLQGVEAYDALTTVHPTFIIVDISTNDVANGALAVMVANAVVLLAHEIIDVFGVRQWELKKKTEAQPSASFIEIRDMAVWWTAEMDAGKRQVCAASQEAAVEDGVMAMLKVIVEQQQQLIRTLGAPTTTDDCRRRNVKGNCYQCGQPGHYARECRRRSPGFSD